MGQKKIWHDFEPHQSLHHKFHIFRTRLEDIAALSQELTSNVQQELGKSKGNIVEEINSALLERQKNVQSFALHHIEAMNHMAQIYTNHINKINTQQVKIYYEEKELSKK
ncbi:hypothetical protein ACFQPF_17915 [Fictibacillus iocasae]|uniref:Uncharacterized protein n=1 Tax=Fictibacillus iocasae TaxID=2715437 RepID=A0ABW2NVV8_9BACL